MCPRLNTVLGQPRMVIIRVKDIISGDLRVSLKHPALRRAYSGILYQGSWDCSVGPAIKGEYTVARPLRVA